MGQPRKRKAVRLFFSGMSETEESQVMRQKQYSKGLPLFTSYSDIKLSCRDRCIREISLAHDNALKNILEPYVDKVLRVADQKGETLPTALLTVTLSAVDRDGIAKGIERLLQPNLLVYTLNSRSCPSKARAMTEVRRVVKEFERRIGREETCGESAVAAPLLFTPSSRLVVLLPQVERMNSEGLDSLLGELTAVRRRGICVSILLLLSPLVPFPVDALRFETSAALRVTNVGVISTRHILYVAWGNLLTSARLPFVLGSYLLKALQTSFDIESGSYVTVRDILTAALERHIITSSLGFLHIPSSCDSTTSCQLSAPQIVQNPPLNEAAAQQQPPPPLWDEKRLADCFHWAGMATVAISFLVRMAISVNPNVNPISVVLKYHEAFEGDDDHLLIGVLNECRDSFLRNRENNLPELINGLLELLSQPDGQSQLLHANTRRRIIGNAKILRKALDQGEGDEWVRIHIQILFFSIFYCSRNCSRWQNTDEWKALCCNGTGLFPPVNIDGGGDDSNSTSNGCVDSDFSIALFFQPRQTFVKELRLRPPSDIDNNKDFSSPTEDVSIAFSCLRGLPNDSAHVNEWFHGFSNALLDNNNTVVVDKRKEIQMKRKEGKPKGKKEVNANLEEEHAARFKWACESLVTQLGLVKRRGSHYQIVTCAGIPTTLK